MGSSGASCDSLEKSLEQCLQCQDTRSLYRQALRMTLSWLATDRERRAMTEVAARSHLRDVASHPQSCDSSTFLSAPPPPSPPHPQMLCLVCASHNGLSESEALDLLPDLELPLLLRLLERLRRLCVVTLRCGLIRFQHLQVRKRAVARCSSRTMHPRVQTFPFFFFFFFSRPGKP